MKVKPFEVSVFYHSDETLKSKQLGIDYSLAECDTVIVTVYDVVAVRPYLDEESGVEYAELLYPGDYFTTTMSVAELNSLIQKNIA